MTGSTHTDEPPGQPQADERPALVVVAHWDDELISAWGVMCRRRSDVLCLTDKPMPGYREIFGELVTQLGGRPLNWDIPIRRPDGAYTHLNAPEFVRKLAQCLTAGGYGRVYTHHFDGDIGGHRQHFMVANLCYRAIAAAGRKESTRLMCFASKMSSRGTDRILRCEGDTEAVTLRHDELALRRAYAKRYKSDFEELYPGILSPIERHVAVSVKGFLWRTTLNLRHAWPRIALRAIRRVRPWRGVTPDSPTG